MTPEPAGRPRLTQSDLALERSKCVFINCPFDAEFKDKFEAILFATVCCGFVPRSALESGNVSETRIERITNAIFSSRYSIHDLSRCTGEGTENFARFNMPLELGISMASRFLATEGGHDWLALVPRGHAYQRFVSDLAGYDLESYDESAAGIVAASMKWLATRPDAAPTPIPKAVVDALPAFAAECARLESEWNGYAPWPSVVAAAVDIARQLR